MAKRKRQPGEVSTRTRFEVFKRDLFTCQYCGRKPPEVVLHCDHINAVANGGDSRIENLITACQGCNLGKSDVPLEQSVPSVNEKIERLKEARKQLAAYRKHSNAIEQAVEDDVAFIESVFKQFFPWYKLEPSIRSSVRTFLGKLPRSDVADSMRRACSREKYNVRVACLVFCKICWMKIKGEWYA